MDHLLASGRERLTHICLSSPCLCDTPGDLCHRRHRCLHFLHLHHGQQQHGFHPPEQRTYRSVITPSTRGLNVHTSWDLQGSNCKGDYFSYQAARRKLFFSNVTPPSGFEKCFWSISTNCFLRQRWKDRGGVLESHRHQA